MTFEQIINKVLIRLREKQISVATESDYSTLIGEFVNETKREIEDAWTWTALRESILVNTAAGVNFHSILGAGKRFVLIDVFDRTNEHEILAHHQIAGQRATFQDTAGKPNRYFIKGQDSSGDPIMRLSPNPDAIYIIEHNVYKPQAALTTTDELTIDEWPVILGTYAKALEERGEDGGDQASRALQKYASSVSDLIQLDIAKLHGEDTWYV